MDNKRLNPLNGHLFMKYMSEKGDEKQLTAFLNAVLHKTKRDSIVSVNIIEACLLSANNIGEKTGIMDVHAEMDDGVTVNVVVQLREVHNINKRDLIYWSREYIKGIHCGQSAPHVIIINIMTREFLQINEMHTCFHLWEDSQKDCLLTDALEIHFIDMVKFGRCREKDIEHDALHRWLAFFDKNTDDETISKIVQMDKVIAKAQQKIAVIAQDKGIMRAYREREAAVSSLNSDIEAALKEGEQRGELKQIAAVAVNLWREGFTVEKIAQYIRLPVDEVVKILEEESLI